MQSILAEKLKKVTMKLRAQEKQHFAKVQELHGGPTITNRSDDMMIQQLDEDEDTAALTRSNEVQNLAKSITELATLFKDLSVLVVEQGTVLDRIDYNILEASKNTTQANVHLRKTLQIEKSMRS